jgi:hypothetical protein
MTKYEIIKTHEINYSGRYVEKFLLKKTVNGIPFYMMGDDNILCVFGAVILGFATVVSIVHSFLVPTLVSAIIPFLMPILWYGWHFTAKRKFDNEYDVKNIIEINIAKKLNKEGNVVIRYITDGKSVEVNKFLN